LKPAGKVTAAVSLQAAVGTARDGGTAVPLPKLPRAGAGART